MSEKCKYCGEEHSKYYGTSRYYSDCDPRKLCARIAELEARINTDTCLVCGHTSVTDCEDPCPVCDLAKANKRIAELEAANVEWQHCPHCGATILAAENK